MKNKTQFLLFPSSLCACVPLPLCAFAAISIMQNKANFQDAKNELKPLFDND